MNRREVLTGSVAMAVLSPVPAMAGDRTIERLAAAWREADEIYRRACEIEDEAEAAAQFPGIVLETDRGPVLCKWEGDILKFLPKVGIDRSLLQLAEARIEHEKGVDHARLRNARAAVLRADRACRRTWRALMGARSQSPHDVFVKVRAVIEDSCHGDAFYKEVHADALEAIAGDLSRLG